MRAHLLFAALLLVGCPSGNPDDDDTTADDDDTTADDDDTSPGSWTLDDIVALLASSTDGAELEALLHGIAWESRWPLQEGDRWLFATRWEGAKTLSLVGDINEWDPQATPATASPSGVHWYAVIDESDFVGQAAGAHYKWTDGTTWMGGYDATAYFWDDQGRFGYVSPPTNAAWAEQFPGLTSAELPLPRTIRALLPVGFEPGSAAAGSARTLLMHDGQNLFDPDAFGGGWEMDSLLASDPAFSDIVLVSVDNTEDRLDVYAHVADDPFSNGTLYGGRADAYLGQLEDVVLPHFRERYGLVADGQSLMMAGSSMGGLVSLYAARQWDGGIACVGALSPTLGWGAFSADGSQALVNLWSSDPGHGAVGLFLYSGGYSTDCVDDDGDGVVEESEDQDNICVTDQFRDTVADLGYVFDIDLWHWWEPGAQHVEPAWSAQVPRMLEACSSSGWVAP